MRITSSAFSFRLCAFSVLSARICQASSRSGTTSAVIARAPSAASPTRRCLPFGVQKPFSGAVMAMIGSRKKPVFSITSASRLWCVRRDRAGTASARPCRAAAWRTAAGSCRTDRCSSPARARRWPDTSARGLRVAVRLRDASGRASGRRPRLRLARPGASRDRVSSTFLAMWNDLRQKKRALGRSSAMLERCDPSEGGRGRGWSAVGRLAALGAAGAYLAKGRVGAAESHVTAARSSGGADAGTSVSGSRPQSGALRPASGARAGVDSPFNGGADRSPVGLGNRRRG